MFLSGTRDGVVLAVQQVSIHGTLMLDVTYQLSNEATARSTRIGPEAVTGVLAAGVAVQVTFLMNVVTAIRVV
ncbi:MAG: hypothetical protein RLZZ297_1438 [Chloroflexota bacterium]|jgi:hypothetical protein